MLTGLLCMSCYITEHDVSAAHRKTLMNTLGAFDSVAMAPRAEQACAARRGGARRRLPIEHK